QEFQRVLSGLGPKRAQLVFAWVLKEIDRAPLYGFVTDERGREWELGGDSPVHPGRTIWAILRHDELRAFTALTVETVEDPEKGTGIRYFHEMIYKPEVAEAFMSAGALFNELHDA